MDDFQPRIEDPPPSRAHHADKAAALRRFVVAAAGQWCLVGELRPKPGHDGLSETERSRFRGKLYSAIGRKGVRDVRMRSHFDGATFKVYARYVGPTQATSQTTDSEPKQETK
jgi:hypothetical protein